MVIPLSNTPSYVLRQEDREFYEREVASFLPDRVFDAHCHVWHSDFVKIADIFPPDVDYEMYMRLMQDIHPVPTIGALFISLFRDEDSIAASNEWTAAQTRRPTLPQHVLHSPRRRPGMGPPGGPPARLARAQMLSHDGP